jgi:TonB-dependent receptor
MKLFTFLLLFTSLLVISNNSIVKAQEGSGKIQGTVTDATTGEALFGANVILEGTSYGAATDIDGVYHITGVPQGTYKVSFTYIGYKSYIVTEKVSGGKPLTLNVRLTLEAIEGQTVTVTAQKQGQIGAINQQLTSNTIQDVVAKDYIQEVPDLNAAESIGRLPGVSLERDGGEGNKIIIDGLAPKYNNIEVDGVQLNGTDLDRSAGLEIIQNDMLEGIVLSKSLTADMDADALGGTVNLTLKEADPGFHFGVNGSGAYDSYNQNTSNYKLSVSLGNRFFNNSLGIIGIFSTSKIDRSNDEFSAGYGDYQPKGEPNGFNTNWANVIQNTDERFRSEGDIVIDYATSFMHLKVDNELMQQMDENMQQANFYQISSSAFNPSYYTSKPIETIRTHALTDVFSFLTTELTVHASYSKTTLNNFEDFYQIWDQNLVNPPIGGSQLFLQQPTTLVNEFYNTTFPTTADLQYNYRETTQRKDETYTYKADWKIPYSLGNEISGNVKLGAFFNVKDRNNNYSEINDSFQGGKGEQEWVGMEGSGQFNDIIFNDKAGIPQQNGIPMINFALLNYKWGKLLGGIKEGYSLNFAAADAFFNRVNVFNPAFYYTDGTATYQNDYYNQEKKQAEYIMTELHIGQNLMILPGVRYEDFHSVYQSYFIQQENEATTGIKYIQPVSAVNGANHYFPSVNVKYNINSWSDIRAAYFKSCTRPDYNLLSPGATADEGDESITAENPFLQPAIDNNYDVIYSVHNNEIGLFSIDGFYKEISGLIEGISGYEAKLFNLVTNAPVSLSEQFAADANIYNNPVLFKNSNAVWDNGFDGGFNINNPNMAYVRGIELNWETNFWYLPGLWSNLVLDVNYTHIHSNTLYPYIIVGTKGIPPKPYATYATGEDALVDQPNDIFNIRFGWDYKGFSTRLTCEFQGQILTSPDPEFEITNYYQQSQFKMDWSAKQKLTNNLSVMADVSNLNNFIAQSNIHYLGNLYPTDETSYGILVDIGLRYDLQ